MKVVLICPVEAKALHSLEQSMAFQHQKKNWAATFHVDCLHSFEGNTVVLLQITCWRVVQVQLVSDRWSHVVVAGVESKATRLSVHVACERAEQLDAVDVAANVRAVCQPPLVNASKLPAASGSCARLRRVDANSRECYLHPKSCQTSSPSCPSHSARERAVLWDQSDFAFVLVDDFDEQATTEGMHGFVSIWGWHSLTKHLIFHSTCSDLLVAPLESRLNHHCCWMNLHLTCAILPNQEVMVLSLVEGELALLSQHVSQHGMTTRVVLVEAIEAPQSECNAVGDDTFLRFGNAHACGIAPSRSTCAASRYH